MATRPSTVLVVGATGSIGRLVVEEANRQGNATRALVRHPDKARRLPEAVVGEVTRPGTLADAVEGIDAVVFTLGSEAPERSGPRPSITAGCPTF